MILAAGLGTRLRPLTDSLPKPLLPVAGTPLIVWNLLLLRKHGIREVIINLHYLGDLIEKELGDGSKWGMSLSYSHEWTLLGTGGGIKQAQWFFGEDPFLVLNGDTLLELDLATVTACHREGAALATMVLRDDLDADRWGAVEIDDRQHVLRIIGRGRSVEPAMGKRMFAGVHVMDPRLLHEVPYGRESSIIDAYVREIERGSVVLGYTMEGYWSDVGTPERYAQVQHDADTGVIDVSARQ
jgi:mannose-1-phosphate guanylyltransferase